MVFVDSTSSVTLISDPEYLSPLLFCKFLFPFDKICLQVTSFEKPFLTYLTNRRCKLMFMCLAVKGDTHSDTRFRILSRFSFFSVLFCPFRFFFFSLSLSPPLLLFFSSFFPPPSLLPLVPSLRILKQTLLQLIFLVLCVLGTQYNYIQLIPCSWKLNIIM